MTIEGIPLIGLGAPGILGLAVLMLLTGRIVPKTIMDEKKAEADQWKKAYENEREARRLDESANAELLEVSKTTQAMMKAIMTQVDRIALRQKQRGGENYVVDESETSGSQ